jgi:putative ABC transport system permease protein
MRSIGKDIQFALRAFRKSPVFTAVALLSLALGIGANTAIFTLLDQVLLRLMPVKNPQELALLHMEGFHYGDNWGMNSLSYPMYRDFQANNTVFSGMFCRFEYLFSVGFNGTTERVNGELVSGTYFPVLGVSAAIGRTLTPDDDRVPDGHPVVVLSNAYWRSRFAGDPSIVGKTVAVNGHNFTVAGVAQRGFDGVDPGDAQQIFVPVMMRPALIPLLNEEFDFHNRRTRWVQVFGRLKPGVTRERAQASLQPFFHSMLQMEEQQAAFNQASAEVRARFLQNVIQVLPGGQGQWYFRKLLTTPLWVLMALTGGVLLIACANVASLLIARAASRQKEIAIRLAIGAGRIRIIRQLLVESLLLSIAGGVLGLVLAIWTDHALLAFLPPDTHGFNLSTTPDLRILGFALAVSMLTGLIFGLAPALQSTTPDVAPALKDTAGGVVGGGAHVRVRKALVAAQVMLSLLLLVGAGLFIRSLRNLQDLGPGFPTGNLVAFQLDPSLNGYSSDRAKLFYRQLTAELSAMPGVRSVGLAMIRILEQNESDSWLTIEGYRPKPTETPDAFMNYIGPGYFTTLGVPLLAGRDFTEKDTQSVRHSDRPDSMVPRAVIVNERFAKRFFGSVERTIGRHVGYGIDPGTKMDMEIIGVVKDIKYMNLRDDPPVQMFDPYLASNFVSGMTVYVRTTMSPDQVFGAVRGRVRALDSNLPLYGMRTMDEQISNSLLIERLIASLSAVFGFLATVLAVIGLYGVMAYTVARRTREIGIRMALGAFQGDVIWMVMREVLVLVAIGIGAGLAAAIALSKFVQAQLYGVTGQDPMTIALAGLLLAAVACAAGYIPALRASRIDAMRALRYE